MKKKMVAVMLCVLLLGSLCGFTNETNADRIFLGTIYTADAQESIVEAIAIKDGIVVYSGDAAGVESWQGENTEVIELGEGMAVPGFVDAHSHGSQGGVAALYQVDLYGETSVEAYVDNIVEYIAANPDVEFIYASGWENGYMPTECNFMELLDRASAEKPIVAVSQDHHSYWVNSAAMEIIGVTKDSPDIEGGLITRDEQGNPTGIFRENANALPAEIIPDYTVEQYKEGILHYQQEAASYGVVAYWDPLINESENLIQAYEELDAEDALLIKVFGGYRINEADADADGSFTTVLDAFSQAMERNKGGNYELAAIKLFADGVIEGHTAYMLDDYADTEGDRGEGLWTVEGVREFVTEADARGLVVHTHAIGDAGVRLLVDAIAAAREANPDSTVRHAITHLQVAAAEDIARMAELNIIAVANPYWFLKEPGYFEELERPFLGEDRANHEYPMKDFYDAGVVVTNASDYPVTIPPMPLLSIQTGVIRAYPYAPETQLGLDQCVTVQQMLQANTYNGFYEYSAEDVAGSLEVGKQANVVVLDQNILTCDPNTIADTTVLMTLFEGNLIYSDR